ncbi:cob(II)yrinic acid a,c-diamide reductase [Sphingomonas laterariae]|uniref:Cob(II)yrinic acid a,c-diamide reductase n=1 Tax=Edaphosphingomonas laterariae TaxID=861865 RepID=A0A239G8J3_9SPHN|nr:5,6-dimethylbenzimidazole synthase [Sphingomonas laterariae]SNS65430.1 cob(II)yrinic acid a,c-diamide reductase [Sphingomonas laterariae]
MADRDVAAGAPEFDDQFQQELADLLAWRRDVRHFRSDPLPDAALDDLLRLAALAPSVGNAQPWRFVRLRTPELRSVLAKHVDDEVEQAGARYGDDGRRALYRSLKLHGLREAPEILAVFSDESPDAGHGLGIQTMPEALRYSTVMAIHTLWLAARARGIGIGWVSIVDPAAMTELLAVPPDWHFIALLCVGYPEAPSAIPELERRGWQARHAWVAGLIER